MGTVVYMVILSLSILALGVWVFWSVRGVRAYLQARGKRLVTCPETHCAAAVEIDLKARAGGPFGVEATSACRIVHAGPSGRIAPRIACSRSRPGARGAGPQHRGGVVQRQDLRLLSQAGGQDRGMDWPHASPAGSGYEDPDVGRGPAREAAGGLRELQARLLVMPHCGNLPPRPPGAGHRPTAALVSPPARGMTARHAAGLESDRGISSGGTATRPVSCRWISDTECPRTAPCRD